jgi:transposase-like protein
MQHLKRWLLTCHMPEAEVKEMADELGIDAGPISKWRQQHSLLEKSPVGLTDEQKESRRLQKELKEALLERDILKKAVSIFSKGDGRYTWAL